MGMTNEYQRAHRRVARLRGSASNHTCICGGPAHEWAYQHTDARALRDERGLAYSDDPAHYQPMCKRCHARLDYQHQTPEQRQAGVDHMRWVQTQRRAYDSPEHAEAARENAAKARAAIDRTDPAYLARMVEAGRKSGAVRRHCSCGLESSRAGIGTHQKATGHKGYTDN